MEQENLDIISEKEASDNTDKIQLNVSYNNEICFLNKKIPKLSKGKTFTEEAIGKIIRKQSQLNMMITKLKEYDCNSSRNQLSNTIVSGDTYKNKRLKRKVTAVRNKEGIKRYRTFTDTMIDQLAKANNVNININFNNRPSNTKKYYMIENHISEDEPRSDSLIPKEDEELPRKSESLWKLSKNTFRILKGFTKHDVKKLEEESDLLEDIQTYKNLKGQPKKTGVKNSYSLVNFMNKNEMEKEFIRVHLKESALKIVQEGSKNFRKELDEIFRKNQERYVYDTSHPNFLFNQPLPDTKKTLLYTACQDGNLELVEYFLSKNLDPSIKSKSDDDELENCIQVAARWNYINIVKLLLDSGKVQEIDIQEILKNKYIKKPVINLLYEHTNKKNKGKKRGCACF